MKQQCVILASGKGTRMYSQKPKVMHEIAGCPMLLHVINNAKKIGITKPIVTINPQMLEIKSDELFANVEFITQDEQLGTAHAVASARSAIDETSDSILVLYGDTPLVRSSTLQSMLEQISKGTDIIALGFRPKNPTGYGRLLLDENGYLKEIIEEAEANHKQKEITLCNSGVMAFNSKIIFKLLDKVGNNNNKGEYYLTDTIMVANELGLNCGIIECLEEEVIGVNNRKQLAEAEMIYQQWRREEIMLSGVTMTDPESVYFSYDTKIGNDVSIEANVIFGPGVTINNNAIIKGFSHIEGAVIDSDAIVGPYARIRPGTNIGPGVKVGNFVEIKKSDIASQAKINHLSYIGDAMVDEDANIGAGTITCNYDGFNKHKTHIGKNAFIGSNSSLVAPITISDGAYIGSGSTITTSIKENALALTRAELTIKPDWAKRFRDANKQRKKK